MFPRLARFTFIYSSILKPSPCKQYASLTQRAFTRGLSTAATPASTGLQGTNPSTEDNGEEYVEEHAYHAYANDVPVRFHSTTGTIATELYKRSITVAMSDVELTPSEIFEGVAEDLTALEEVVSDPDVAQAISDIEDPEALNQFAEYLGENLEIDFVDVKEILVQKQMPHIKEILADYQTLVSRLLQEYTLKVRAASETEVPSEATLKELFELPPNARLDVEIEIDEDLIGGFVASTDELYIDLSLKQKVQALEAALEAARNAQIEKEYNDMIADLASN